MQKVWITSKVRREAAYWQRHSNLLAAITLGMGVAACYFRELIGVAVAWLIGEY